MSMVFGEAHASLSLRLLGPMEVLCGGKPLEHVRSRKAYWLLALLGLHANRELSREWVAGIIWPDSDLARETMRRTLTDLRSALGSCAESLVATKQTICLRIPETDVDALRFDALSDRGDLASWDEAIGLYHGPLVEACCEMWFDAERIRRADAYVGLLERAAGAHAEASNFATAITYLRIAVKADPFREKLHRDLMLALVASGAPSEALLVYRDLRLLLHQAAQSEPSAETVALYRTLRTEANDKRSEALSTTKTSAPQTAGALPPNFPRPLTGLIGREREMAQVADRLAHSRLVTVTGSGGIGKTRMAVELGARLRETFSDGAYFVDLSPVSDPARVVRTIARELDVKEKPGQDLITSVIEWCQSRTFLIVVDNCEQVIQECSQTVRALLLECPHLSILATSRQALRITGEVVYSLAPLPVPDRDPNDHSPALQLFLERASAVRTDFRPTPEVLKAASLICRKLDGVPLALELAAARTRSLSVEQVAERLQDRFRLLRGGDRTHPLRQQSLSALIDWSYDLLEPSEQVFFSRLSLFEGGCNLEAAAAVCHFDGADATAESVTDPKIDFDTWEVLDLLDSLVDKSLVYTVHYPDGETRYRMLETLREYGREKVEARGEVDELQRRHAKWFLHMAERTETAMRGAGLSHGLHQMERDSDNFRAAERSLESDLDRLRLAGALFMHWYIHGCYSEGRQILESVLQKTPDAPIAARCKAMKALGDLCWAQGDMEAARRVHTANLELQLTQDDHRGIAVTWNSLGLVSYHQGDSALARENYARALAIIRTLNEPLVLGNGLINLALATKDTGDSAAAEAYLQEAETIFRSAGQRNGLGKVLHTIALLAIRRGDYGRARQSIEEAMQIDHDVNDTKALAIGRHTLGEIALDLRDLGEAENCFREALAEFDRLGARRFSAAALYSLSEVERARHAWSRAAQYRSDSLKVHQESGDQLSSIYILISDALQKHATGQSECAARLLAAMETELRRLKATPHPRLTKEYTVTTAAIRAKLGEATYDALYRESKDWTLDVAIEASGL